MSIEPKKILAVATIAIGQRDKNLGEICKYLKRYGYLRHDYRLRDHRMDRELSGAIRRFQVLTGLMKRGSGKTSFPTRRQMTKKRCGMDRAKPKRRAGALGFNALATEIGWDHRTLKYEFGDCSLVSLSGLATEQEAKDAIVTAFRSWESVVTGLQFVESIWSPEIKIAWFRADDDPECPTHGCHLSNIDHAHADFPPDNTLFGGLPLPVHFNADESWGVRQEPLAYDIETIALHEIGHCLGLFHGPGEVMKEFRQVGEIVRNIDPITSNRIRGLYP